MSRDLLDEDYYVSHGGMIPVKWTAPEVHIDELLHLKNPYYHAVIVGYSLQEVLHCG